jgi:hypothetical protein
VCSSDLLDKWGQIVFQSSDSEFRWLGNKNNGDHYLPSDIYTYKLIYSFKDSKKESVTSHVALIR